MTRPLLLDLYCGAGGCSVGYHRAGFDVIGVDLHPQPNYPYAFVQGDALEVEERLLRTHDFAAIHASPPCQAFSSIAKQVRKLRPGAYEHPDLVEPTRDLLIASGLPYVMENVIGAPLRNPIMLCGSSFGLDVRRHRIFELGGFSCMALPCAHHWQKPRFRSLDQRRGDRLASVVGVHGHLNYPGEKKLREAAMGIDWMDTDELAQAIPPAYTEYVGVQLRQHIEDATRRSDYLLHGRRL